MNATQHDLSYNHTKLDYQALLRTAKIAYALTRNEIARLIHQTYDLKPALTHDHIARLLFDESERMVIAAETMHTLEDGLSRRELEIVNKSDVKESLA